MERQNVWGNNLIDFNKLTGRSNGFSRWFVVGYLMGLVGENYSVNGCLSQSQLFDTEIDTIELNQIGVDDVAISTIENEIRPIFGSLVDSTSDRVCLVSSTLGFNNVHDINEDSGLLARGLVDSFWAGINDHLGLTAVAQVLINEVAEEVASLSEDWANRFAFVEGSGFAAEVLLDDALVSKGDSVGGIVYNSLQSLPIVADTLVEFREVLGSSIQGVGSEYIKLVRGYIV
jgi:hypothetical protein